MRAILQRVSSASMTVIADGRRLKRAEIEAGLVVLVGVRADDSEADARYIAQKTAGIRIFEDSEGKMNLGPAEAGASILLISNFTLYGDCRKGRRPSFTDAAGGAEAERLYLQCGKCIEEAGLAVKYGVFGAEMEVVIVNDGPVTLMLDSRRQF